MGFYGCGASLYQLPTGVQYGSVRETAASLAYMLLLYGATKCYTT